MKFNHVFDHWTYETFPPGRLLRRRYNSFQKLIELEEECLHIISLIEDIGFGLTQADWSNIEKLSADLGLKVRAMLEQLQEMNPVRFMDIMDYYNKINFYVRMAVTVPDPEISKPFTFPLEDSLDFANKAGAYAANLARIKQDGMPVLDGMVIGADIYNYFIEANDLRIAIDNILETVTSTDLDDLKQISTAIIAVFQQGNMPESIANEIEIAALETSRGSGNLTVSVGVTPEGKSQPLPESYCRISPVPAQNIVEVWKKAVLCKFSPEAIKARIELGYADRESPAAMIIQPVKDVHDSGFIETFHKTDEELPLKDRVTGCSAISRDKAGFQYLISRRNKQRVLAKPDPSPLSSHSVKTIASLGRQVEKLFEAPQRCGWITDLRNRVIITSTCPHPSEGIKEVERIKLALTYIANLNISPQNTEMFLPEKSRSMYDLVRFANEKGVEEMFSLVSKKGLGLDGAKHMKARQPISLDILNLADGLFTTAAGKLDISPDDIKSAPMWALWFGLGAERPGWNKENAIEGCAILSKTYMNITLKSEKDLTEVDAVCDPDTTQNHIHFRFKGGSGTPQQRISRTRFIKMVLIPQGFTVKSQGDLIEATYGQAGEAEIQKLLATIGHTTAHIATHHPITENHDKIDVEVSKFISGLG
ncbi:PEP/pyruvate-binding domain-containing protein [Maridesulfovibrio hydrothermalis]|uniref:Phosphoenolpyruvate synthase n=1 Tax=Maridesulfovibrio hydrothermalis AM13 = DSM 14728 TaxID=1121451 RepID=L0RE96_9BACT|nr:PEP/pyruvate-binding domain-containing protein [Maridesulfovibrio hydrothermalis]CCO25118.1 Pyruvate phosphate dikinase PEP/pyruvate-binding [Maridesulfovibrio hydrothermalis AM13 = DSM 14728]